MPYDFITLKRSVLTGSLSRENAATKWLFITMILESTEGVIVATEGHLSRVSGFSERRDVDTVEENEAFALRKVKEALEVLQAKAKAEA